MNIHEHINEKTELAKTYAEDGAFFSAARVLKDLAGDVHRHADTCFRAEQRKNNHPIKRAIDTAR